MSKFILYFIGRKFLSTVSPQVTDALTFYENMHKNINKDIEDIKKKNLINVLKGYEKTKKKIEARINSLNNLCIDTGLFILNDNNDKKEGIE